MIVLSILAAVLILVAILALVWLLAAVAFGEDFEEEIQPRPLRPWERP